MTIAITIVATFLATLLYVVGFYFFMSNGPSIGSTIAWLFSPITVPFSLLILLVAY